MFGLEKLNFDKLALEGILKSALPMITPHIKPGLQKLVELGKKYSEDVEFDKNRNEKEVAGIILIRGDDFIIAPIVFRKNENGKDEISRSLGKHYTADELADLLLQNIGKPEKTKKK